MGKKLANVYKEVEIRPDAELWLGSYILLKKANADQLDSIYLIIASIIFSAFSIEAYLNNIGKKIYNKREWKIFERKNRFINLIYYVKNLILN
jgi:hypothetical protein